MRKHLLSELVEQGSELTAVNSEEPTRPNRAAPLGSKGAVGAISRALTQLASDRDAEPYPSRGVVELDTALLVDSAFRDRLDEPGANCAALVASIREAGQQVPILVRPVPSDRGRYQIAYGHRRVAALRELGRPVRAVIHSLTDDEMIVAQGAENGARKDLSFIERAHFAHTLEHDGISRATIIAALSVDKTELSRLISVARSVPLEFIKEIGPAPKVGRRRWMEFAQRLEPTTALDNARQVMESERFKALEDSDARFMRLFSAAAQKRARVSPPEVWTDEAGRKLARVARPDGRFVLSIDERLEPAFGDYLLGRLPEILASFHRRERA